MAAAYGPSYGKQAFGIAWIVKIDSAGILQWKSPLVEANTDYAYSVIQTMTEDLHLP